MTDFDTKKWNISVDELYIGDVFADTKEEALSLAKEIFNISPTAKIFISLDDLYS